jgi:hypothetical protein
MASFWTQKRLMKRVEFQICFLSESEKRESGTETSPFFGKQFVHTLFLPYTL